MITSLHSTPRPRISAGRWVRTGLGFGLLLGTLTSARGQAARPRVVTSDIDRFWLAYDSIRGTTDSLRQLGYLQRLYLAPGSPGLHAFGEAKGYTAADWVSAIRRYPRFWNSIRPRTQLAKAGAPELQPYLDRLQGLYPALRPATIYFTVGALRSGGTTQGRAVLIGAELATGNATADLSEFAPATRSFLAQHFARDPLRQLGPLCVHEYVHTQQSHYGYNVLSQALYEGTCDFLTELVVGQPLDLPYRQYGPAHEAALKQRFRTEMFQPHFNRWFYNQESADPNHVADLGYYMGYAICRAYYQRAADKPRAIREMIELDYTSAEAVEAFLARSGYYPSGSIARFRGAYEAQRPVVTGIRPLPPAGRAVSADLQEITVEFSRPMGPYTSIDYGPGGAATWPLQGRGVFAPDGRSVTYQVRLQPGRAYEFQITDGGFRSKEGYPVVPYRVSFRTAP
jgi:hypothetical protein